MRTTLLSLACLTLTVGATAQVCTPDPLYADSLFGVWPDTTENFASGMVGLQYDQVLNLKVPADAGAIDPAFAGVVLDSVQFGGVTGLPPGLSVACASQTPASCTYITGVLGCGVITGVPTTVGVYPLVLEVTAYASLFGNALPIPYSFSGYSIEITENTTSIIDHSAPGLGQVRNVPNPFAVRTHIEFELSKVSAVKVRVFNLVGEELWMQTVQGKAGLNRVPFESGSMEEGVYLYKVESGKENFTGRMVLYR